MTGVALASAVTFGVFAVPSTAFASGFKVPFTDTNQVGSLTLCNSHEQPITSGSLLTIPFVWRAVSSTSAPAGYTRATLYLAQPIQYLDPEDWTSQPLTDDAIFSNRAHPMAQATYADAALYGEDHAMPPYWDGLYELRLYFSGPNMEFDTGPYPAAVIKVTGDTWTLVQGGGSSCTDGKAESMASFVLPKSDTAVPKPPLKVVSDAQIAGAKTKSKKGSTSPTNTQATVGSSTTTATAGSAIGDTSGKGGGSPEGVIAGIALAALVLAGASALIVFRRRRQVA
ncbi:MAG: hypothetical protein ABSG36_16490 [Acidimicrobiales bacterium]|jgi:hypothetical protein